MQEIQNSPKNAAWICATYKTSNSAVKKMAARILSVSGRISLKGHNNQTVTALTSETKCKRKVNQKYRIILYRLDSSGSGSSSTIPGFGICQSSIKRARKPGTRVTQNFRLSGK